MKKLDIKKASNFLIFSITLIPILLFLFVVWNRLSLPFVFEWGESAGISLIHRVLSGSAIYAQPNLEFSPLVYTPLYYYLAAGVSIIIGNPLFSARILSVIAAIITSFLIGRLIQRETGNSLIAWISGSLFLAFYSLVDGFYDLARVDSLYVLMIIIAFCVVLRAKTNKRHIIFGLLLAAGFFIKQSFVIVFLPLQIYILYRSWKISWPSVAAQASGIAIPLFLINRYTGNWFSYYIFELPKEHGYSFISAVNFWIGDTIRPLGIVFAFSLVYLLASKIIIGHKIPKINKSSTESHYPAGAGQAGDWWIYSLFVLGAAGASWITRSSNGGGVNNCMLIYAALAISFGLGVSTILKTKWCQEKSWHYAFVMFLVSIQFIGLFYNPFAFIPTKDEIRLNEDLQNRIQELNSEVLIPYRSHLSGDLTQTPHIHIVNLFELTGYFKGEIQPSGSILIDQIRSNLCRQSYGLVVLDQRVPWFEDQLIDAYVLDADLAGVEYQQSRLMDWQQGNLRTYIPKENVDLDQCLSSFASDLD